MTLELRGITKRFGSLVANDRIDLTFEPGRIHALLGENGAGKSTMMNVLYGLYTPDEGQILIDGVPVTFHGPGDAMAAGIGMVHQHFMLIPVFTVAENVVLGHEPTGPLGIIGLEQARTLVREISARFGFDVDPDAKIEDLPVGVQQRVEIIKALSRDAKVLILDEPTAVLTPQETDELIEIMRQLRDSGTAIVFITHKLREVRAVADEITVIRRGKVVGTASPTDSQAELASLMVGRDVSLGVEKGPAEPNEQALEVAGLSVLDAVGSPVVRDVSFTIRGGEVLAVAGVQGNGQSELAEVILGLRKATAGSITLDGTELLGKSVDQVLRAGVGFVPEDRSKDGLISSFSIIENFVLDQYAQEPYAKGPAMQLGVARQKAAEAVEAFDVRTTSIDDPVSTLSGGNQQKVVLAREMSRPLRLFVASQPTRGLDVGSIEFVHQRIIAERDAGTPVLIVSTELDEVLSIADRIAVMYRGSIVGIVEAGTDRDVLGLMMAGVPPEEARQEAVEHPTAMHEVEGEEPS
ncbi:ABC transporter ATP-binding protein [Ruania alkalisoli]|uniref:ABC transporter ATP-binding protein n=1 Tax=Ruania alkalisoli TaxID=2779775 RepID=A0A7M1SXJ1_9MICO|nr:ABC transporter ATP-binding protein [Ruania alkalisoli]QOR71737.1 ABC transporter ATP-binding protein [Ruania alkalisoli]